jgi:hypothetical protein
MCWVRRAAGAALPVAVLAAGVLAAGVLPGSAAAATGGRWRVVFRHHYGPAPAQSEFSALAVLGAGDVWAFGSANGDAGPAEAAHWNDRRWRQVILPRGLGGSLVAASASGPDDVWAVTWFSGRVIRWNGRQWTVVFRWPRGGVVTGISVLSRRDVWVFGGGGPGTGRGTWHYDGRRWTRVGGAARGLAAASARSADDIWAIRPGLPAGAVVRFNGRAWRQVPARPLRGAQLQGIAVAGRSVYVTAERNGTGPARIVRWSAGRWQVLADPWPRLGVGQVIPDGRGGAWVVAYGHGRQYGSWILHRSAAGGWTRTRISRRLEQAIQQLAPVPGTPAWWAAGLTGAPGGGTAAAIYAHGPPVPRRAPPSAGGQPGG